MHILDSHRARYGIDCQHGYTREETEIRLCEMVAVEIAPGYLAIEKFNSYPEPSGSFLSNTVLDGENT